MNTFRLGYVCRNVRDLSQGATNNSEEGNLRRPFKKLVKGIVTEEITREKGDKKERGQEKLVKS